MNYKELDLKKSYKSYGSDNIASSFINPVLKHTKYYRRSVGFFSSSVFEVIIPGVVNLARNNGNIRIIASPRLSDDDIKVIKMGYELKQKLIDERAEHDLREAIDSLDDESLKILVELISRGVVDIKIAVTKGGGMYHDKLGIFEDFSRNKIVFYGSPNESLSGYKYNYEKIRVAFSWVEADRVSVEDEINEFDSLWEGMNEFVEVRSFNEVAEKSLIRVISDRKNNPNKDPIKLRDYQEQAISKWKGNGYRGFYVMATGTGKTWTAIFSAKELLKEKRVMLAICAPYKHLLKQWAEDIMVTFPESNIILVSSENSKWEEEITEAIIRSNYDDSLQIIIISTIKSFNTDRFENSIKKYKNEKLLIVDEAHRFTSRKDDLKIKYKYMLGLSATPNNGKNLEKGQELLDFFGGVVYSLTIEDALDRGYLVQYNYYPIFVNATEDEENRFKKISGLMAGCFKNGVCIDYDRFIKYHRNRLRLISMAAEKTDKIDSILGNIKELDHLVVYCGDGKLFDDEQNELRHIQYIKRKLNESGYKSSQFTATENMTTRMQLVESFNKNEISALAAIRCLDEGINIPSIKSALILSSNDDYKEFVQRRGRILRTYGDKKEANIYDVIVLPSTDLETMAQIELRRFNEYARLSLNSEELADKLQELLNYYNLSQEDIQIKTDLLEEGDYDE